MDLERITSITSAARADGREGLLEPEGLEILEAMGFTPPHHDCVHGAAEVASVDLTRFPGHRVVVKVVAPGISHKSESGGVAVVDKEPKAIAKAIRGMERTLQQHDVRGFLIYEYVPYDRSLGGELLYGVRWTADFGAVVTYSAGGIYTEFLAQHFIPGREVALAIPADLDAQAARQLIEQVAVTTLIAGEARGQKPRIEISALVDVFLRFAELARAAFPKLLTELEVNPFVVHDRRLVPLDVLAKCEGRIESRPVQRPIHKLRNLLQPRSAAIIGVSERMNPGHVVLNNMIRAGFDRERIHVIKPDSDSLEGCACYPDVGSLPEKVDLFVLSVAAAQAPELVNTIIEEEKAESIILIPGGLGEKSGSEGLVSQMQAAIASARQSTWGGPVINGGNCMGIRSVPGNYDTTFIPDYKLRARRDGIYPVALISQSGAYLAAKNSKLGFDLRYAISIGNQMDLTVGDYLMYLKDDAEIQVFAVYAEGFRRMDGLRTLEACRAIMRSGRTVVLYRAGRTQEGVEASASHTAAIAGDYTLTRELARHAGVVVCDSTDDFEDLVKLFALLADKEVRGMRLGAVSNAGFESVAVADRLGGFTLPDFSAETQTALQDVLGKGRIDRIVDVRNPMDITPMSEDAAYEEAIRWVMGDNNVDVGFVGCVPLTAALNTLPPGTDHPEDVYGADSIARRLINLKDESPKAWVAAVDGGRDYDAMATLLEENGVPTFRTADRALRLFARFCEARMKASADRRNRTEGAPR